MDAPRPNHYVIGLGARSGRPIRIDALELLLFLTAMLAGLLSGDRVVDARQVEQAAVAAAAAVDAGFALAEEAEEAAGLSVVRPDIGSAGSPAPARPEAAPSASAPVDERRLE